MPDSYDPYMAGYFLNTVTDMALLEIRRERGIELLLENCRWDDDMRWGMGKLLEQPWYGVYVGELGKVYDMDGDGTGDVCFVRESPSVSEPGVTYRVLGNDYTLTDGDSGYIECYIRMNLSLIHISSAFRVRVLGTVFNVRSFSGESVAEATLAEGSVALQHPGGRNLICLHPGQQAVYDLSLIHI